MNGNVQCQQTIICCNNFNGVSSLFLLPPFALEGRLDVLMREGYKFQFCMGDIDFNIPITINMNLGGGGGAGKGGKKKTS